MEITTVGLDLAKNIFQVHAITSTGEVVVRRALRRAQHERHPPAQLYMRLRLTQASEGPTLAQTRLRGPKRALCD